MIHIATIFPRENRNLRPENAAQNQKCKKTTKHMAHTEGFSTLEDRESRIRLMKPNPSPPPPRGLVCRCISFTANQAHPTVTQRL